MRPSARHCACTAAGSTAASRGTQAGMAPQQLPTFFTTQSASLRQERSGASGEAGAAGPAGAAGGGAAQPARTSSRAMTACFMARPSRLARAGRGPAAAGTAAAVPGGSARPRVAQGHAAVEYRTSRRMVVAVGHEVAQPLELERLLRLGGGGGRLDVAGDDTARVGVDVVAVRPAVLAGVRVRHGEQPV